jgi:transposase
MDIIYEIRRRHSLQRQTFSTIAREMGLSRPTLSKHLNTVEEPKYERVQPIAPKLGEFEVQLTQWLEDEAQLARPRRRTAHRLFEGLQEIGYGGAYDSVQRFVKRWKSRHHGPKLKEAFVPLLFVAGDACQFDWSHEQVELGGVLQTIKVAHFRLAYSRQIFVVAYLRETQEMVLEAHNRAFAFFGGVPAHLIYDNLKTVVEAVFTGKERKFKRRFLCLANHYLFEPVAFNQRLAGRRGKSRIGSAISANGCSRHWRASLRSLNSTTGWPRAARSWRNVAILRRASAPLLTNSRCFVRSRPALMAMSRT